MSTNKEPYYHTVERELLEIQPSVYYGMAKHYYNNKNLQKGNLKLALEYSNKAIKIGKYNTVRKATTLRGHIYYDLSKKQLSLVDKINYAEKSFHDGLRDKINENYLIDLYLAHSLKLAIDNDFWYTIPIFEKIVKLNNHYEPILRLLKSWIDSHSGESENYKQLILSEIYAANLQIQKAFELAEKVKSNSKELKARANFDLAKYSAIAGNEIKAIDLLNEFFLKKDLFAYYNEYREIAKYTQEFIPLFKYPKFNNWMDGVHRIKLSLNNVIDIPQGDRREFKPPERFNSDPYLILRHKSVDILKTQHYQDVTQIYWSPNLYRAVFDYDVDDVIYMQILDSDATTDHVVAESSTTGYFPSNWTVTFSNGYTKLNLSIEDASELDFTYSTYNRFPEKFGAFTIFENSLIKRGQETLDVYYEVPKYDTPSGMILSIQSVGSKLLPCFSSSAVSIYMKSFWGRQISYTIIKGLSNQEINNRDVFNSLLEKSLKDMGYQTLENINNIRTFCECVYDAYNK